MTAPVKELVQMEDGREVEFVGAKKKMGKEVLSVDGQVQVRFDFRNGATRTFIAPDSLINVLAAHGAEQKIGDATAGVAEIDDCILAVEDMIKRLEAGEWLAKRESSGMAGTSILIRALVEYSGKDVEAIKGYLADKTQAQKLALRSNPAVKVIVDRLEAEKAANKKGPQIDTDALLGELSN
jgi:uncharacterized small protein (DUF1192 family)